MPFEIPRGIWVPEIIWLAFYSPKSNGISRENVKIEVIFTGQTPSNMKGKCQILTNFQGGFGLESTNRDFEFGTKSRVILKDTDLHRPTQTNTDLHRPH